MKNSISKNKDHILEQKSNPYVIHFSKFTASLGATGVCRMETFIEECHDILKDQFKIYSFMNY